MTYVYTCWSVLHLLSPVLQCVYFEFLMTAMKGIKMAVHITEADSDCPSFREVLCQLEAVIKKARDHPLVVGGEDAVVRLVSVNV